MLSNSEIALQLVCNWLQMIALNGKFDKAGPDNQVYLTSHVDLKPGQSLADADMRLLAQLQKTVEVTFLT